MSTHRRGVRPSQWPVRDLLGPENASGTVLGRAGRRRRGGAARVRCGRDRRPQLGQPGGVGPAARGSRFAAGDPGPGATRSGRSAACRSAAGRCRRRLPSRSLPARVVAPRPRSARPQHRRAAPRHRTAVPAPSARDVPVEGDAAPQDRTLAEQVATAIDGWEGRTGPDGTVVGWLLVPVQRPADAAALLDVACVDEPCHERSSGGRHRARDRDAEQRVDRHHEARGGRHRAPDRHREDRGGRHRAPEQDDQRSTPYRFVMDDGAGQDEAGRGERGRAEVRAGRADRHERDRTVHDAAQDREERRAATVVRRRSADGRGPVTTGLRVMTRFR